MDRIIIKGGERLQGEVRISGAKNAALPILASSLLTGGTSTFRNVPQLGDIKTMRHLLEILGATTGGDRTLTVCAQDIHCFDAPYDLVKTMRASVLVLGPLVARFGKARVSLPGGCAIGARPVNLHIKALQDLGAHVELNNGYVEARAKKLKGANIYKGV